MHAVEPVGALFTSSPSLTSVARLDFVLPPASGNLQVNRRSAAGLSAIVRHGRQLRDPGAARWLVDIAIAVACVFVASAMSVRWLPGFERLHLRLFLFILGGPATGIAIGGISSFGVTGIPCIVIWFASQRYVRSRSRVALGIATLTWWFCGFLVTGCAWI